MTASYTGRSVAFHKLRVGEYRSGSSPFERCDPLNCGDVLFVDDWPYWHEFSCIKDPGHLGEHESGSVLAYAGVTWVKDGLYVRAIRDDCGRLVPDG